MQINLTLQELVIIREALYDYIDSFHDAAIDWEDSRESYDAKADLISDTYLKMKNIEF